MDCLSKWALCESYIAYKKYRFNKLEFDNIVNQLINTFPTIDLDIKYDNLILKYIKSDKKNSNGIYNFTLIKEIGKSIINCPVSDEEVLSSLDFYRKNVQTSIK